MKRRLFIAIELPQDFRRKLNTVIDHLRKDLPQVKWESEDKLHLTLKFLGDTGVDPEKILDNLRKNLLSQRKFTVEFGDLSKFENHKTVIFWEVKKSEDLESLFSKIEQGTSEVGFTRENRLFHPHLTLGRSRKVITDLTPTTINLSPFSVSSVTLFQSHLTKYGSIYIKLGEIEFPSY